MLDLTRSRGQVGGRTPANVFSAGGCVWLPGWLVTSEKDGVKKKPARSEKERVMDTEESGEQRGMWNGKNITWVFKMGRRTRHVPSFVFFILILFSILFFIFFYLYIFIGLFGWFYYKLYYRF